MAEKNDLEIAETILNNHYHGTDLVGENPNNKTGNIEKTNLYTYNEDIGIWQRIDHDIIVDKLVYEFDKTKKSQIVNIMFLVCLNAIKKFKEYEGGFNSHKDKIVLKNGVFDINTQEFGEFDRHLLSTVALGFDYEPKATCPKFRKFMNEIFEEDQEMIEYFQEVQGYLFAPTTKYEAVFILVGEGQNGKSTWEKVMKGILGRENFSDIHIKELADRLSLVNMRNKLVNFSEEIDDSGQHPIVDTGILKKVSSGIEVTSKALYENPVDYVPFTRQVIICNTLPKVTDTSGGWLRRLHIIKFNYRVPENKKVVDLDKELVKEASGIFNWAMEGYRRLEARGHFAIPLKVKQSVDSYGVDINSASQFILEEVGIENLPKEDTYSHFYALFKEWCYSNNPKGVYKSRTFYDNVERFCNVYTDAKIKIRYSFGTDHVKMVHFEVKLKKDRPVTSEGITEIFTS